MPELPEVEVLARHLAPLVQGRTIRAVDVRRAKVVEPSSPRALARRLAGATFTGLERRGKYLLFQLRPRRGETFFALGHLGMTGRMFLQPARAPLPKHAAIVLDLGRLRFVYEDPRYFGRFTLDTTALDALGPEPLGGEFTVERFAAALARSAQAIKVKLLDQSLVAGVGNIYASEALFRAGLSPRRAACRLRREEIGRLHAAIRAVLSEAIDCGSTIPLDFAGGRNGDRLFYFGRAADAPDYYTERLRVYDRAGHPCPNCATSIRRVVQAARSTYFCPRCQR
ncbi:MAG: bifunctional DNA-formamidopyrimidine glycosylase/DNA-(apurinic or apyrimidinic site) lyase [Limisphaerales bacterium]